MIITKTSICLNKIDDIKRFFQIANKIPNPIDVSQGRYNIDAKSSLGLYLLNLEEPVDLTIYGEITADNLYKLENFNAV